MFAGFCILQRIAVKLLCPTMFYCRLSNSITQSFANSIQIQNRFPDCQLKTLRGQRPGFHDALYPMTFSPPLPFYYHLWISLMKLELFEWVQVKKLNFCCQIKREHGWTFWDFFHTKKQGKFTSTVKKWYDTLLSPKCRTLFMQGYPNSFWGYRQSPSISLWKYGNMETEYRSLAFISHPE